MGNKIDSISTLVTHNTTPKKQHSVVVNLESLAETISNFQLNDIKSFKSSIEQLSSDHQIQPDSIISNLLEIRSEKFGGVSKKNETVIKIDQLLINYDEKVAQQIANQESKCQQKIYSTLSKFDSKINSVKRHNKSEGTHYEALISGNRARVNGDGNCQFSSIALALNAVRGTSFNHETVRQKVVAFMEANKPYFENFFADTDEETNTFEAYLTKMKQIGTWGDNRTIQAAANLYNISITIRTNDSNQRIHSIHTADKNFCSNIPASEITLLYS